MSGLAGLGAAAVAKVSGVGKLFGKVPWQVWAGLAAIAALLLGVHMHSNAVKRAYSAAYAKGVSDTKVAVVAAQAKATALLEAQKRDTEGRYAALATQKDQEYASQLQDARAAAARYIATHQLRPAQTAGGGGQAVAGADDHGASVPAAMPADPFVLIRQSDVQKCTDDATYAIASHNWALGLGKATVDPKGPQR